jgi:AbrB family looped-hinge helix DNA binding protein
MEKFLTTVSSKGQMVIPAKLREELGIEAGTQIQVRREGEELVLRPRTRASRLRLIDELCGLTAGGPSGTEMLLRERQVERALEFARDGF